MVTALSKIFMVFTVHNQSSNMTFVLPMEWGIKLAMCGATWSKIQDGNPALGNHLGSFYIYICICVYVYSICMYVWLRATLHQRIILLTSVTPVFAPCLNPWSWSNSWACRNVMKMPWVLSRQGWAQGVLKEPGCWQLPTSTWVILRLLCISSFNPRYGRMIPTDQYTGDISKKLSAGVHGRPRPSSAPWGPSARAARARAALKTYPIMRVIDTIPTPLGWAWEGCGGRWMVGFVWVCVVGELVCADEKKLVDHSWSTSINSQAKRKQMETTHVFSSGNPVAMGSLYGSLSWNMPLGKLWFERVHHSISLEMEKYLTPSKDFTFWCVSTSKSILGIPNFHHGFTTDSPRHQGGTCHRPWPRHNRSLADGDF